MTGPRTTTVPADLTRNEGLVLGALRREDGPLSAYQLLETLRADGLRAPPQVYRALKSLGERGLVHKLDSRNAFLACTHTHGHGPVSHVVVFLVCERCEAVEEVCDEGLDDAVAALCERRRFARTLASAEIRGRCGNCIAA